MPKTIQTKTSRQKVEYLRELKDYNNLIKEHKILSQIKSEKRSYIQRQKYFSIVFKLNKLKKNLKID
jgi:hypothetical protein|uniref:Uncharacterized protein n=1 Tax=viral metagenome TaxID=1070528 RepID=A0A6C0J1U1_9ZZZZ